MTESNPWQIASNLIAGQKRYAIYRLIKSSEVDHSGNREYFDGVWSTDRDAIEAELLEINRKDDKHDYQ